MREEPWESKTKGSRKEADFLSLEEAVLSVRLGWRTITLELTENAGSSFLFRKPDSEVWSEVWDSVSLSISGDSEARGPRAPLRTAGTPGLEEEAWEPAGAGMWETPAGLPLALLTWLPPPGVLPFVGADKQETFQEGESGRFST